MEIYKDLSNPAFKEFEQLLNSQLSKVNIEEGKIIEGKINKITEKFVFLFVEGQTTALVIRDYLEKMNLKITQLAYGVPVGSEIHYLDDNTLGAALESRKNLS